MADPSNPYEVAAAIVAAVEQAFTEAGRALGRSQIAVGSFVIDDCCVGLLTVMVERVYRTTLPWPTEAGSDDECAGNPIALDVLVRLDRCVPVVQNTGEAPAAAAVEEAHAGLYFDAAVLWNLLGGTDILGDDGDGDYAWQRGQLAQDFIGADGGCVAVETRVTFGVQSDEWCLP